MKNIFISYSSKEYDVAAKFRAAFAARGMNCWMAPESIPVGSNYAIEIPKAIQNCQVFVLILSENSQNSIWVRKEIDLAVNLNKLIFPIRIGNYQLISPFDFYLTDIQLMQATDEPEQLAVKLEQLLEPSSAHVSEVAYGANTLPLVNSHTSAVTGEVALTCDKKLTIKVGSGVTITCDGNTGGVTIKTNKEIKLDSAQISAKASGTAEVSSSGALTLKASGVTTVKGSMTKIN